MGTSLAQKVEFKVRQRLFVRRGEIAVNRDRAGLIRLGSRYGGWWLDAALLDAMGPHDLMISCGAGEDISFDLEVQKRTGCHVVLVDPTPKAIRHFDQLRAAAATGGTIPINNGVHFYPTAGVDFSKISFEPFAVWNQDGTLKLWVPPDPNHVSLSVVNYENSDKSIEVPATTVSAVAAKYQADAVAIVKLDIENAEVVVVNDLLDRGLRPQQLAVEFDELNFPNRHTMTALRQMLAKIQRCGYAARFFDGEANFLFIRDAATSS